MTKQEYNKGNMTIILPNSSIAKLNSVLFVLGIGIVPDLMSGAGVDSVDVIGRREVDDAIHQDRRSFDLRVGAALERPG